MKNLKPRSVEDYLLNGCGRCALGGTPACKVHSWEPELEQLRRIVLDCELIEELKWDVPCFTYKKNNIVIVSAFKAYASISFFKGALLKDEEGILEKPGPNTQAGRLIKFASVAQILKLEPKIKAFIYEAIEVEKAGLKVAYKKDVEPYPEELVQAFDRNSDFKAAFEALTPGRQRGYLLHFSQPKQSATRQSRIEKCMAKIFEGKGWNDR